MEIAFLSLGNTWATKYEEFAAGLVEKLAAHEIALRSVGYNAYGHEDPLTQIKNLMDVSVGAIVVAFKRFEFASGTEKGLDLADSPVFLTTPWNHIEGAMAHDRGLPLLVIVEDGVMPSGVLEAKLPWYVHRMAFEIEQLSSAEFEARLASWLKTVAKYSSERSLQPSDGGTSAESTVQAKAADVTVGDLARSMKIGHVLALLAGVVALLFVIFEWGVYVGGA